MNLADWWNALPYDVQTELEDWENNGGPMAPYQDFYTVQEVARALRLTPITVRQYVRENRINAKRVGKKWLIPSDAVARYIYNCTHDAKADEGIPMGIVCLWANQAGSILADYKFASARELATFADTPDLDRFMGKEQGSRWWCELWPVNAVEWFLDYVGLLTRDLDEIKRRNKALTLSDSRFDFSCDVLFELDDLARREWLSASISVIERVFKELFDRDPDAVDLRLFKRVLLERTENQRTFQNPEG